MALDGFWDGVYILFLVLTCLGSVFLFVKFLAARVGPKLTWQRAAPAAPRLVEPPAIFARLKDLGFTVIADKEYSAFPGGRVGGYAVRYAPESVYKCRACGQRGKHAFGETVEIDSGWSGTMWLGHLCGRCGHFERYPSAADGGGFFGLVLDDAACMLDLIAAIESHGKAPLLAKMERVLAEREAVLMAKANVVGIVRREIVERLGGSSLVPYRSLQGTSKFLA